jgi:hypothetical protein
MPNIHIVRRVLLRPRTVAAAAAEGTVTFDALSAETFDGAGETVDHTTHTVGSGSNRVLIGLAAWGAASAPTGVTMAWDPAGTNQSLTSIQELTSGSVKVALFGLVAPTSGNLTLRCSWTNGAEIFIAAVSFTNADQTGGATTFPSPTTGTGVATISQSSATNRKVVGVMANLATYSGLLGTEIFENSVNGSVISSAGAYYDGAASVTVGSASTSTAIISCQIKGA